jgi:hypothetical protein
MTPRATWPRVILFHAVFCSVVVLLLLASGRESAAPPELLERPPPAVWDDIAATVRLSLTRDGVLVNTTTDCLNCGSAACKSRECWPRFVGIGTVASDPATAAPAISIVALDTRGRVLHRHTAAGIRFKSRARESSTLAASGAAGVASPGMTTVRRAFCATRPTQIALQPGVAALFPLHTSLSRYECGSRTFGVGDGYDAAAATAAATAAAAAADHPDLVIAAAPLPAATAAVAVELRTAPGSVVFLCGNIRPPVLRSPPVPVARFCRWLADARVRNTLCGSADAWRPAPPMPLPATLALP